jgi:feruloyl esterase
MSRTATRPDEAQAIRIGIGLPINSADGGAGGVQGAWNGKLQNLGGGGLVGSVGATDERYQ